MTEQIEQILVLARKAKDDAQSRTVRFALAIACSELERASFEQTCYEAKIGKTA